VEWRVYVQGTLVFFIGLAAMQGKYRKRQERLAKEAEQSKSESKR